MKKEIWKAVPNYKKIYQASDKGRVRSLNRVSSMRRIINNQSWVE